MTKQRQHFEKIAEYRERFRKLPSETIRARLAGSPPLIKEAAIAYREVLEERARREEQADTDNSPPPPRR